MQPPGLLPDDHRRLEYGWMPTMLWFLLGSFFIGGVHDMGALVASIRHKATGIADTMIEYVSKRVWILFNIFNSSLVMIIVACTDLTTSSFINTVTLDDGSLLGAVQRRLRQF
jgi:carbon starvation protein